MRSSCPPSPVLPPCPRCCCCCSCCCCCRAAASSSSNSRFLKYRTYSAESASVAWGHWTKRWTKRCNQLIPCTHETGPVGNGCELVEAEALRALIPARPRVPFPPTATVSFPAPLPYPTARCPPYLQCIHVRVAARQLVDGVVALRDVMEGHVGKASIRGQLGCDGDAAGKGMRSGAPATLLLHLHPRCRASPTAPSSAPLG